VAAQPAHTHAPTGSADEVREQLAFVQRVAQIGIWQWDLAANVVRWSDELHTIYGTSRERFTPTFEGYLNLVHPDDRDRVVGIVQASAASGAPFDLDHRIVRPDGQVRTLHAQGHAIRDAKGRVVRMYGTGQDVTDLRRAQASEKAATRLVELDAFKSDFISKAAHELRTPMLPIRVQTHILASSLAAQSDVRQRKALDSLERNLDRLNRLVDDLLEASRVQSGRVKLEKQAFDLADLVDEAVESFEAVAKQFGVRLVWRPRKGLIVDADPSRMMQVLHNLLGNAFKFTPSGGTVTITLEPAGPKARLAVRDTGAGIRTDEIGLLFQPFSRTSVGKENKAPGTGLGLYVTKGIVEEHDGRVWVESRGENQGATFMVELPLTSKPAQPVSAVARAPAWWRDAGPGDRAQRFKELI